MTDLEKNECAYCGGDVTFMNGAFPLCEVCVNMFEQAGWIQRLPLQAYRVTPSGLTKFPALETVAYCINDGMAIYRRWVDVGISTADPTFLCPYCLGVQGEIRNPKVYHFAGGQRVTEVDKPS
jgi:hypothetical protein